MASEPQQSRNSQQQIALVTKFSEDMRNILNIIEHGKRENMRHSCPEKVLLFLLQQHSDQQEQFQEVADKFTSSERDDKPLDIIGEIQEKALCKEDPVMLESIPIGNNLSLKPDSEDALLSNSEDFNIANEMKQKLKEDGYYIVVSNSTADKEGKPTNNGHYYVIYKKVMNLF